MRTKTLIVLVVVAVLAVAGALVLERQSSPQTSVADGSLLYPGLRDRLNEIARIEILRPGADTPVVLERTESGWVVVPRAGYPADAGDIRQLLLRLADARIAEIKTANPDLYPRLDVADDGEGAGTLLSIGPPADVALIVGSRGAGGTGTHVRRRGETQSYLVDAELEVDLPEPEWLDRELLDIDPAAIARVEIVHDDGETLDLYRIGERLVAAGIPEGREMSSLGAAQPIARALTGLGFEDVMPVTEFDGGDPDATASFHLKDGRRITARAWRTDDTRWLALSVAMDPAPETAAREPAEPSTDQLTPDGGGNQAGEGGSGTAADDTPQRADPESVARMDAALAGWVFQVPVHRYEQIVRRMDDLLKPEAS